MRSYSRRKMKMDSYTIQMFEVNNTKEYFNICYTILILTTQFDTYLFSSILINKNTCKRYQFEQ
jgi:hypothetical protein